MEKGIDFDILINDSFLSMCQDKTLSPYGHENEVSKELRG